ncbi:mechanosensitive ion channel domain-containing protein [Aureimonas sp. ME7]|uniref:mechanosensitive ion channel domain-containing protein n=1 Tax=Aureimonas sp. ME7 TaxID=2744252 RepID=UPI0015F3DD9E|nr:mechanosensitive ion channel domain-containing protein [Aureimonas sp. ME7]
MIRQTGIRAFALSCLALLTLMIWPAIGFAQVPSVLNPAVSSTNSTAPAEATSAAERASLDDLIRILETEATRNRLIESLKASAYQSGTPAANGAVSATEETLGESVPAYLASYTRSSIKTAQEGMTEFGALLTQAGRFLAGAKTINLPRVWAAVLPVSTVALTTLAAFAVFSLIRRRASHWLGARASAKAPVLRVALAALSVLADALAVLLAAAAGHLASVVQSGGPPDLDEALFLNAFVLTELVKAGLTGFVSPAQPALRLTPFSDGQARYWYRRLAFVVSLLGYTFLFVAPIVQANSSIAAGNAVRFLVVFAAFLIMLFLILANRERVARRLQRAHREGARNFQARFYNALGHVWWLLAASFVSALFALWISSPRNGFQFMLGASLASIAAMAVGGLIVSILTKFIIRGFRIPATTKDRFPLLERRVNSFIPKLLLVVRVIVIAVVFGVILDAWSVVEFDAFLQGEFGQRIARGLVGALVILTIGFCVYLLISSWVEYRLNPNFGTVPTARERTLLSLFRNAITVALAVVVFMLVLSQIGINIAPLLAGAGVVGLAIGFGAQKLVQDIITGAFIQIENALNEGDVVQLGAVSGVVEKLTIRSVSLRSLDGTYYLIPFSSVDQVANMTKDFSNFVADVSVAYGEDVGEVKDVMARAFDRVRESPEGINIIADFEMLGVETLVDNAVTVRGRIRTLPGKQWAIGRIYKEVVKALLSERDIESPFARTAFLSGDIAHHPGAEAKPGVRPKFPKTVSRNPDGSLIPPDPKPDDDGDEDSR